MLNPVATMIKTSKTNGSIKRLHDVLKADDFYLLRQLIRINHHKSDLMENRNNLNNYRTVIRGGEMTKYLGGADLRFNIIFEYSVKIENLLLGV